VWMPVLLRLDEHIVWGEAAQQNGQADVFLSIPAWLVYIEVRGALVEPGINERGVARSVVLPLNA